MLQELWPMRAGSKWAELRTTNTLRHSRPGPAKIISSLHSEQTNKLLVPLLSTLLWRLSLLSVSPFHHSSSQTLAPLTCSHEPPPLCSSSLNLDSVPFSAHRLLLPHRFLLLCLTVPMRRG